MKKIISLILTAMMFASVLASSVVTADATVDPADSYVVQTAPYEDTDIRMWFQHPNVKVRQEDTASTGKNTYSVYMAKNEYHGAQVTLYSPDVTKSLISAEVTPFTAMDGSGTTLSADVYYEFYIKCENLDTTGVFGVNDPAQSIIKNGMIPDAMAKVSEINRRAAPGKFTLTAGKTQTLYIKVKSEPDTPSGWYSAQFNVTDSSGQVIKTATVYAYVWDFEIPEEIHLQTGYYLNYAAYGSDPMYKNAYDYLLDNRICAFHIPGEINSSNPYLTNPRVNSIAIQGRDSYACNLTGAEIRDIYDDLSTMEEWDTVKEKLYFYTCDEPMSQEQVDGLYALYGRRYNTLDNVREAYNRVKGGWPEDPYCLVAFHENHPYPAGYDKNTAYVASTGQYLQSDDHSGRFDNVADAVQGMMNEGTCSVWCVQPYFYTPASTLASAGYSGNNWSSLKMRSMNGTISGFSLEYNSIINGGNYFNWDSKYGSFSYRFNNYKQQQALQGKNVKLWNYVCGNETAYTYCNHVIENTGLQEEILFWQTMQTGATGFLYYGANLWNENSSTCSAEGSSIAYDGSTVSDLWRVNRYQMANVRGTFNVYGNGVIIYGKDMKTQLRIGSTNEPLGTVRVEHIRDGIEDYEMLYMYREAYGEAAMNTIINKVSSNVASYLSMPSFNRSAYPSSMTNEDVFAAVRRELGDAVEAAQTAHEHTWDEGVVTVAPTYTTEGEITYTCTECGETYTDVIPPLEPMIGDVNGDGALNVKDLTLLKKYVAGSVSADDVVLVNCDIDGDEAIGIKDIAALRKLIAGT